MAINTAVKKPKIEKDSFTPDGVRLFNPTKEHGTIYADGFFEGKHVQEYEGREVMYRGDGTPVGYKEGTPLPQPMDEVTAENAALRSRIAELEAGQKRMLELLEKIQGAPVEVPKTLSLKPK